MSVGPDEGLRHESSVHRDGLVSVPKSMLAQFVGRLAESRLPELDRALAAALGLDASHLAQAESPL